MRHGIVQKDDVAGLARDLLWWCEIDGRVWEALVPSGSATEVSNARTPTRAH